jgi:hypothetical protein
VNFVPDRGAIRALPQAEERQQNDQLELTEAVAGRHMNYSTRHIDETDGERLAAK